MLMHHAQLANNPLRWAMTRHAARLARPSVLLKNRDSLARFAAPLSGKIPNRRHDSDQHHNNSSYFHALIEHRIFNLGGVVIAVHCHRNLRLP
jgi:hypothetical protein